MRCRERSGRRDLFYDDDGVPTELAFEEELVRYAAEDIAFRNMIEFFFPGYRVKTISWDLITDMKAVIKFEKVE